MSERALLMAFCLGAVLAGFPAYWIGQREGRESAPEWMAAQANRDRAQDAAWDRFVLENDPGSNVCDRIRELVLDDLAADPGREEPTNP